MDSDSIGDRLKEIQISKESIEEVPKILSPELRDVFPIFANMLDIKSFMKLAMASKNMYKRCMENKDIGINVDVNELTVSNRNGSLESDFSFKDAFFKNHVCALQKLPCKFNVHSLQIWEAPSVFTLADVYKYVKEIGVNKIYEVTFDCLDKIEEFEAGIAIIKDFDVKSLCITSSTNNDILRSLLQLNLEKFTCWHGFPIGVFLENDSPIRDISLPSLHSISKEELMDILSKIQSGSLRRLSVPSRAVEWRNFDSLPFDYQGPLPDERPLLFAIEQKPERVFRSDYFEQYAFLHWHGGVTKCTTKGYDTLEISKCEPWELPCILRKEEDVLKDLAEKLPRVSCSADQFRTFARSLTVVDHSHKGPLPDSRPLCFLLSENYWLLDEHENLIKCSWIGGFASRKAFNLNDCGRRAVNRGISHRKLTELIFWEALKQIEGNSIKINCRKDEFNSWFDGFEKLDFEYSGPLPSSRPLIFERAYARDAVYRFVLLEQDRLLDCVFCQNSVTVQPTRYLSGPPFLLTARNIMDILKDPNCKNMSLNISFEVFRDGLELLKNSISVLRKSLLISEKTETEIWFRTGDVVRKAVWENGRLSISHFRDTPTTM